MRTQLDYIAGTGMGSIIAGLYASGLTLVESGMGCQVGSAVTPGGRRASDLFDMCIGKYAGVQSSASSR